VAAGHPALAGDIGEFHQRCRAAALALATDNDTTADHLGNSAAAYRRTDAEATAQLADRLAALPVPRDPNSGDQDGGRNGDHQNDRNTQLYEIWPARRAPIGPPEGDQQV
jgi:hypothetical protein